MDNGKRESIIKEHIARTPYNETHIASRSQILRHIAKQTESGVSHYLSSIEMPVDGRTTPPHLQLTLRPTGNKGSLASKAGLGPSP